MVSMISEHESVYVKQPQYYSVQLDVPSNPTLSMFMTKAKSPD
jgi:hypothetical protein